MKAFLKENLVLVAGIALPLVLTILFFAATQIEKASTPDPEYKVAYVANDSYNYNNAYQIILRNKQVYLSYVPPQKENHRNNSTLPELYVFDPKTGQNNIIDLPEIKEGAEKQEILIPELATFRFSPNRTSPDGYSFDRNYRRSGNLMKEMFGGGYNRGSNNLSMNNGHKSVTISNTPHYNAQFIGWVIAEKE